MDYIYLKDMIFYAYHGAMEEEKRLGQRFIIDLRLGVDLRPAGKTDDLAKTVNYGEVYQLIKKIMHEAKYDLIEKVAERIAEDIFKDFELVQDVQIMVKKPEVPIPDILAYASIEITRHRPVKAYLALGTNMGDKEANLKNAVADLNSISGIEVTRSASLYNTAPVGYTEQDWFLNTVVEVETDLTPEELLKAVNQAELRGDRKRVVHWGPRTLDIDIILYGDERVNLPQLIIPHERMAERAFVLYPLAELVPDKLHPLLGRSMLELRDALPEGQEIRIHQ